MVFFVLIKQMKLYHFHFVVLKECMFDSVTNYNYVGDTKISVSIKKKIMPTNAH